MDILDRLGMPECEHVRMPVKTLEEQLDTSSKEKKLLESHISSMYLVSLLNEQTIRIRAYKDEDYSFQAIYARNQRSSFEPLVPISEKKKSEFAFTLLASSVLPARRSASETRFLWANNLR